MSSGVRRVEAITGEGSLKHFRRDHQLENVVSGFVASHPSKTAKGGAGRARNGFGVMIPTDENPLLGPQYSRSDALKAELEKKDAEIKRLTRELDQVRMKSASSSTANIAREDSRSEGREGAGASRR